MSELAAIYVRVSTEEQATADKTSLSQQREKCTAYCLSQGWEVVDVYEDAGVSGSLDPEQRPAMSQLLEDAGAGKFQRLVFLKVDRVARSLRKLLNFSHQLQSLKVGLVSVVEQFDTSTASGQLYFSLLGAFAQFEAATINERMSEGRKGAVRNGRYLSSVVPYGYVRENGHLKPHPEQADVVRQVFAWAREGLGVKAIVTRLTEQGIEPPTSPNRKSPQWGWYHTTIYKMLRSRRYIGQAKYSGVPMPCPTLVEQETFDAVQAGLRKRRRDSPRNTKHLYLLQHLLYCRHCSGKYTAKMLKRGGVYLCRQRNVYGPKAGHEGIKWRWHAEDLENVVKAFVLRVLVAPDRFAHDAQLYYDTTMRQVDDYQRHETRLKTTLDELKEEETRAIEGFARQLYSDDQVREVLKTLRLKQNDVRAKLKALATESPAEELSKADKARMLSNWLLTKHSVSLEGKTPDEVLASLFEGGQIDWGLVQGDEGEQEWAWVQDTHKPVSLNEVWRDLITALVSEIWVEDDGTLEINGSVMLIGNATIQIGQGGFEVPVNTPSR